MTKNKPVSRLCGILFNFDVSNSRVSVSGDGFVSGEGAQYSNFASLTEVNEKDNTFDYTLNAGTLADNYNPIFDSCLVK